MGGLVLAGNTSGSTTIQATDAVTATITLPSATGTVQLSGAAGSFTDITTTGNTILGDARTDTLAVGIDNLITDSSGNVLMGKSTTGTTTIGTSITRAGRTNIVTGSGEAIYFYYSASGVNVGSITHSTTAISLNNVAGITFPATQSASTNANTLDDYEEGTWSPVMTTTGTGFTSGGNSGSGTYTKIGNQVTIHFSVNLSGAVSGGTGDLSITGAPFTAVSSTGFGAPLMGRITLTSVGIFCSISGTAISFNRLVSASTQVAVSAANVNGNGTPYVAGTITYQTS